MQILFSLELLLAILFNLNLVAKIRRIFGMDKKNSDRVFGCHAAVEVAMVGISDEDVDKLTKEMLLWHKQAYNR